jgi:hypothetical protein
MYINTHQFYILILRIEHQSQHVMPFFLSTKQKKKGKAKIHATLGISYKK